MICSTLIMEPNHLSSDDQLYNQNLGSFKDRWSLDMRESTTVIINVLLCSHEDKVDLDVVKHAIQQHQASQKIMKMCKIYALDDHMCLLMLFDSSLRNLFKLIKCLKSNFLETQQ